MPLCSTSSISHSKLGIRRFSSLLFSKLASFSSCALQSVESVNGTSTNFTFEELQRSMRSYASSGDLLQALWTCNLMRSFPSKPTIHDYNALFHSYLNHGGNPFSEYLLQVYWEIRSSSGIQLNAITFNLLINGLVAAGNFKVAFFIMEDMFSSGFIPSFTVLSKFLKKSMEIKRLTDSLGVFDVMLMLDYIPTEPSLNVLICMLSKKGMIHEAYMVFSAVLAKGCFFGVYISNPILWSLCKSSRSSTALRLSYWLKKNGVPLDVCSYTALVYGFCKEGNWEDACLCLDEMKESGSKASLVTYTIVVQFLCENGRVEEALRFLNLMEAEGFRPDLLVYNVILRELSRLDRTDEAFRVLHFIVSSGLCPDAYTIAVLAGGLIKAGRVQNAVGFLLDAISEGYSVDVAVFNVYLQCLCRQNRTEEALSWLETGYGERFGFVPSNVSYNIVLNGFCRENKFNMALVVLTLFEPDVVSFNTILSRACKLKNDEMVERILYGMEDKGVGHDVVTLTCLIRYWFRVGKVSRCVKGLDSMLVNGPKPNVVTLNVALDELCKCGSLDLAIRVFEKFRDYGFVPDGTSYSILSRARNQNRNRNRPC